MGMNVGAQPTPPANEPVSSGSTGHAESVDPNQLLLLLPDLDKKVREQQKQARTTKETQEAVKTDAEQKALEDFAKSLIAEPGLPAGSKEALDKWISNQAKQQLTEDTQTQQTAGEDPNLLSMDHPKASPMIRNLGNLAKMMAASQGGKLSQEEVDLLSKAANDLFSASSSTLTEADKSMLLAFLGQLEEFPTTEKKTPSETSASSRSGTTGTSSNDKATKAQEQAIAMDDLGLSDEVHELGQQALQYVQGNNGKLSDDEAKQLETAAEALISGGADGDDLKALQNFLRAILSIPKSAAGESALLLTQAGIDPKMITLAQYANAMLKAQNGTLTQAEADMLKNMAEELMKDLAPEDQALLKSWLTTLGGVKLSQPPPVEVFNPSDLFGPQPPKENPFLKPGIMAMLAPILSEILTVNNEIIKQSSKLKQNMMKLLVAMANEAFQFAMNAGQAKVAQLQKEAAMHLALGISSAVQAGMTAVSFGLQKMGEKKVEAKLEKDLNAKKINEWGNEKKADGTPKDAAKQKAFDAARDDPEIKGNPDAQPGSVKFAEKVAEKYKANNQGVKEADELDVKKFAAEKTARPGFGEKLGFLQAKQQLMAEKGFTHIPTLLGQLGKSADEFITYGFKAAEIQDVVNEYTANAYKEMISQLMQLITQTIQTASDEMSTAQKNFDSFAQLYKDFANTISQSIYRSG